MQALERAAAVAALLIIRQEAVTAVETKYQGDFLRDLLLRNMAADPTYVAEHADTFGWWLQRSLVVVSAELDPTEEPVSNEQRRAWQKRFAAAWRQVCVGLGDGIPTVDFSSEVVTLLPAGKDETRPAGLEIVRRAVTAVAGDKGGGRRPFSVGVSRLAADLEALPRAYGQARRALEIGRRVGNGSRTTYFDQLGLHLSLIHI